jgi:NADPH2:quinone reductase
MKAVLCTQFGLPDTLQVQEVANPVAGPKQVVITVAACGVNFPDVLIIQNKYQFKPELPFSPGGEVAGTLSELGDDVQGLELGQPVLALCGWGGFAEKVAVDADRVFPLPEGISPEVAATTLYTYGTSYHALKDRAQLQAGETLLVLGAAGGVGLAAVELGTLMGARVIAAASTEENDQLRNRGPENANQRVDRRTGGGCGLRSGGREIFGCCFAWYGLERALFGGWLCKWGNPAAPDESSPFEGMFGGWCVLGAVCQARAQG